MNSDSLKQLGVVVIGRNEGARLRGCLESLAAAATNVIYVDSGSGDDSVASAQAAGVEVEELDDSLPFSAARARNAGFERLRRSHPYIRWVQFVDGDCVLDPAWLSRAGRYFEENPDVVAVHGRVHEMHPDKSLYNRLCEIEWSCRGPGESLAFGGIFAVRCDAFEAVGGFDPAVIAAEDDELSLRLRRAGGLIHRLPGSMAQHDAEMEHLSQWWRRSIRLGHAYAQVSDLHSGDAERIFRWETRRALLWGLVMPLLTAAATAAAGPAGLGLLLIYPVQILRVGWQSWRGGLRPGDALMWSSACLLSRFAEVLGVLRYYSNKWSGQPMQIIEHKRP